MLCLVSSALDLPLIDKDKGGIILMGDLLKFVVVIMGDCGKWRVLGLKLGSWYLNDLLGVWGSLPGLRGSTLAVFCFSQAYSVSVERLLSPREYALSS